MAERRSKAGARRAPAARKAAKKSAGGAVRRSKKAAPARARAREVAAAARGRPDSARATPKRVAPAVTVDLARARAHWQRAQGLAAPVGARPDEVAARTGWVRTLGGVDAYLAFRVRAAGLTARGLEGALDRGELRVVPAVRGCMYLVPRSHVPLVLRVASEFYVRRTKREMAQAGVPERELQQVVLGAEEVLRRGPASTEDLRRAMPQGSVRSLGEAGKKVGVSTALPAALRLLELEGRVERTLERGRIDSERYVWRVPKQSALEGARVPEDPVERVALLWEVFLSHSAPATVAHFADWSGVGQREARAALGLLPSLPVRVEGYAEEAWILESQRIALEEAEPVATVSFLGFEDNYVVLHGGPAPLLDPAYHARTAPVWGGGKSERLGDAKHLMARALLLGDRILGFWELDPARQEIVVGTFEAPHNRLRRVIEAQAAQVRRMLVDELDNARCYSIDTEADLARRADWVRTL